MRRLVLIFLLLGVALLAHAHGVKLEASEGYIRLHNISDHRHWCYLETEAGFYNSIWLEAGESTRWRFVGDGWFDWGCK